MKQISSAIMQPQTDEHKKTGTQHGGHGAVTVANSQEVAAWLARQAPRDTDKVADSRLRTHGVTAQVKYEYRFPSGPNGEHLPSYAVAVGCDIAPGGDRAAALSDMRNFLTPAPVRHIEGWLVELSAITAGRGRDGFDAELMLSAYSARLSQYPADVVRHVLLKQAWKWFPTWADLEKMCNAMTGPRNHIIRALEQPEAAPEPKRRKPTDEEKARVQALVDELFPMRSPEMRQMAVDEAMRGRCIVEGDQTDRPDEG